jgi:conjugal transfer/entry exclusion protein
MNNLTIRSATAADAPALARLAELDSNAIPAPPQLVAIDGDQLIAALSASDGAAIADPFTRSADAVEILRRRARQISGSNTPRRRLHLLGNGYRIASW